MMKKKKKRKEESTYVFAAITDLNIADSSAT